ncbi:LacI family DNA-binding transcriptional regulator [Pseudokineococcus lusitanus]|uniref:LacI family transcriptional regulator n=1 Tax=Pseudokineococcus lusitanus TaxID=763993 RepID=A0A3N1HMI7_9ACTN|nr:LacI family DNA-binding transcriptional regulator [Pseudokineococcus lusitanus]ROP43714.1 LacI family transcriptional regulator [Pseudokineococcus lusitanus]
MVDRLDPHPDAEGGVAPVRGAAGVPTLESVAAAAGVSRATASRVLNGSPRVSEAARAGVLAAAEQLSYVPNGAARMLVTRRSDAVAFVVCEQEEVFFSDPFFATVLKGAHRVVVRSGRQVLFVVVADEGDRRRLERFAAGGHLDAAMFLSVHRGEHSPARLAELGMPVVVAGRPPAGVGAQPHVDTDNVGGGRLAAGHLLAVGRRRPVVLTGPPDMPSSADRVRGLREVLAAGGVHLPDAAAEPGHYSVEGGRTAMALLLDRFPDLDGVFAANDLMAVGALGVLRERGRRVPEDVAVVGYDDIPLASATSPPLTTVHQPLEELGRRMATALVRALDGPPGGDPAGTAEVVQAALGEPLQTRLVVRGSA